MKPQGNIVEAPSIAICIPAFGRIDEYRALLDSALLLEVFPSEIIVCEDGSAERDALRLLSQQYAIRLKNKNCMLIFHENVKNLGYDGNLRQLLQIATTDYVFFIGNDDHLLPKAIAIAQKYLATHNVLAASRTFLRFKDNPEKHLGVSRCFSQDMVLNARNATSGTMLRIGGFFGGLIFNRQWAMGKTTHRYDGSLFYQIYLLLMAFAEGDVGYIATPTVAARADNAPLFGTASSEKEHFTPGRYTAKARGRMWQSILLIAKECEQSTQQPMLSSIKHELATRMSFHVFEMFTSRPKKELIALKVELQRIGLFSHPIPHFLFAVNFLFGRHARHFYSLARRLIQK